jgi:hypothetical protein
MIPSLAPFTPKRPALLALFPLPSRFLSMPKT